MVGRLFRMSGNGRKALPESWEWSEGPYGVPGVVGRPFRRSGSGRIALPKVREWSEGTSGGKGDV